MLDVSSPMPLVMMCSLGKRPCFKVSGGIKNDGAHSQISTIVCNHRMEGQFHFLAL